MIQGVKCLRCGNKDVDIENQQDASVWFGYDTGEVEFDCWCDRCGYKFKKHMEFKFTITNIYDLEGE